MMASRIIVSTRLISTVVGMFFRELTKGIVGK